MKTINIYFTMNDFTIKMRGNRRKHKYRVVKYGTLF